MTDQTFPAGWYEDPLGRFEQRFYDGTAWTARVQTNSNESHDPIEATSPTSGTTDRSPDAEVTRVVAAPSASGAAAPSPAPGAGAAPAAGAVAFLDALGPHALERERPELPLALGGLGGALASLGIIVLIGQNGSQGTILAGAVVALAVAVAVIFKVVEAQPWLRSAAVGAAAVAFFALAVGIVGPDTTSENAFGLFLLIGGLLHLAAWVAPGFRGRPFMLGGGLIATAIGLAVLVAGGRCESTNFVNQCNFAEDRRQPDRT